MNKNFEIYELAEERRFLEKEFKLNFGKKLSNYMNLNKISVVMLSEGINYDKQHIYGILNGMKAPSMYCLYRISQFLKVSPSFFWNDCEVGKRINDKQKILYEKIEYNISDESFLNYLCYQVDIYYKYFN